MKTSLREGQLAGLRACVEVGKELAERHIAVAKPLAHNQGLGDPDLAVFLKGSKETDAYRFDLEWAQEFAMRSRLNMMALFEWAVGEHFGAHGLDVAFG